MKFITGVAIITLVVTNILSAQGVFDGEREGPFIGFNLGAGYTSIVQTTGSTSSDRENRISLMTDYRLGVAPSSQFQIYWMGKLSWFGITNIYEEDLIIANGLHGPALGFYFSDNERSPYITLGAGFSTWMAPFEVYSETWYGIGGMVGAGYQFQTNWSIEGNLVWTNPEKENYTTESLWGRLTFNFTAY